MIVKRGGSILLGNLVKLAQAALTSAAKREGLRRKHQLADAIEAQINLLFKNSDWEKRSFKAIRKAVGGFDEAHDELRRHLVRVGATRSGEAGDDEYWKFVVDGDSTRKERPQDGENEGEPHWLSRRPVQVIVGAVILVLVWIGGNYGLIECQFIQWFGDGWC